MLYRGGSSGVPMVLLEVSQTLCSLNNAMSLLLCHVPSGMLCYLHYVMSPRYVMFSPLCHVPSFMLCPLHNVMSAPLCNVPAVILIAGLKNGSG